MSRIRLDAITKTFGGHCAVSQLALECADGELLVLFGGSGAGKSTTLRLVAGIEKPDTGRILLDETQVNDWPPEQRDVAMAFESYALYPHLTVRDHLEFPLRAPGRRLQRAAIESRVREVADLLEIGALLTRRPTQLSGGQRQRVSLGRALVRRARATLLDEPVAHLDARLRHDLRGELKSHLKKSGTTTIYATPDFSEAAAIADRMVVMIDGQVRQVGTPESVYDAPADIDVALLAGDLKMNIFNAERVRAFAPAAPLPAATVQVGVRPSRIGIQAQPQPVALPGKVYVVEPMGYDQIVRVAIGDQVVTARMPLDSGSFEMGQPVWLTPDWHTAHLFDSSGLRIGPSH